VVSKRIHAEFNAVLKVLYKRARHYCYLPNETTALAKNWYDQCDSCFRTKKCDSKQILEYAQALEKDTKNIIEDNSNLPSQNHL
jgi:hypothetical protein